MICKLTDKVSVNEARIHGMLKYSKPLKHILIQSQSDTEIYKYIHESEQIVYPTYYNGFLAAVIYAYNNHLNLCLSPDHVWFVICQAIATHIDVNHNTLRNVLVNHQDKKQIRGDGLIYEHAINDIINTVKADCKCPEIIDILTCSFSTTTTTTKVASQINIMSTFKNYYDFEIELQCGIPNIVLTGTLEDWELILEKIHKLQNMDLKIEWWLSELKPIILKFIDVFHNIAEEEFWGKIINVEQEWGSGYTTYISGWIGTFFPYCGRKQIRKNLTSKIKTSRLPSGLASVEFVNVESLRKYEFNSGFMGCVIDEKQRSISPNIVWFVKEKTSISEENTIKHIERHDTLPLELPDATIYNDKFCCKIC